MATPLGTWQNQVFGVLMTDTRAAIATCGYTYVYCAVACVLFPDDVGDDVAHAAAWIAARSANEETICARMCHGLRADYELAIAWFGYEAVYFGVACVVFPEAVDLSCP